MPSVPNIGIVLAVAQSPVSDDQSRAKPGPQGRPRLMPGDPLRLRSCRLWRGRSSGLPLGAGSAGASRLACLPRMRGRRGVMHTSFLSHYPVSDTGQTGAMVLRVHAIVLQRLSATFGAASVTYGAAKRQLSPDFRSKKGRSPFLFYSSYSSGRNRAVISMC